MNTQIEPTPEQFSQWLAEAMRSVSGASQALLLPRGLTGLIAGEVARLAFAAGAAAAVDHVPGAKEMVGAAPAEGKVGDDGIPLGPFSEHDLRQQWNQQADEFNQWDLLDSCEQLAWAQARAIAADRARWGRPAPAPAEGEAAKLVALIRQIALTWEPDACLLGNMTAGQLACAADLLALAYATGPELWEPIPLLPAQRQAATEESLAAAPVPVAEGEVAELAKWLYRLADERTCNRRRGIRPHPSALTRAAVLLERQAALVPVPVSERPWEREGWCDDEGRCWAFNEHLPAWEFLPCIDSRKWADLFLAAHALPLPSGEVEK